MKTIIILITLILLIAAPVGASMDLLGKYDRDNDGMINASERIVLDIDIESGRLTIPEGFTGDMIAEDGSILLSPEMREYMTTGYHDRQGTCNITVMKKVVEPEVVSTIAPEYVDLTVPEEPVEQNNIKPVSLLFLLSIFMILLVLYIVIWRIR